MDEPTLSDAAKRHLARGALYSFTAAALSPPSDDTFEALADDLVQESVLVAAGRLGIASSVGDVLDAFNATDRETIADAYDALFGIPSEQGSYPVVPYETHYTVGEDIGQQQRRIAALVDLASQVGLEPASRFKERQDHIVTELELMQVLSTQRANAIHTDEENLVGRVHDIEATLLEEHLIGFAPALADDLAAEATSTYYEATARLLAHLVEQDHTAQIGGHDVPEPAEVLS